MADTAEEHSVFMEDAAALCTARQARFTPLRRTVLQLLRAADRPVSAYELLQQLSRMRNRRPGPPTIYRALSFLVGQGLCTRLESRNAYIASTHPENVRSGIVFICDTCSTAAQIESDAVAALIEGDAAALGFEIKYRVLELQGTCQHCRGSTSA